MSNGRQRGWGLVLVAVGVAALVGCSSSGAAAAPTKTAPAKTSATAAPPEEQRTTAAAVAEGMRTIDQIAKDVAASAGTDKAAAESLAHKIEPAWQPIEGTVKQNDENTYIAMEDAFALLKKAAEDGNAAAGASGATAISTAVRDYLSKYPG